MILLPNKITFLWIIDLLIGRFSELSHKRVAGECWNPIGNLYETRSVIITPRPVSHFLFVVWQCYTWRIDWYALRCSWPNFLYLFEGWRFHQLSFCGNRIWKRWFEKRKTFFQYGLWQSWCEETCRIRRWTKPLSICPYFYI